MAYNFKNLADVELLNAMPEEANIVVEVDGKTKRVPSDGLGGGIDAIVFSVIEAARAAVETPTYQTVCNHTLEEVRDLMLAGAGCVLIAPPPAGATASTLKMHGPTPTVMTMSAAMGTQSDNGSVQFLFMAMDSQVTITYNAVGTITNSLLSA